MSAEFHEEVLLFLPCITLSLLPDLVTVTSVTTYPADCHPLSPSSSTSIHVLCIHHHPQSFILLDV
eukprot:760924-Hanusia_phi.AAC.2